MSERIETKELAQFLTELKVFCGTVQLREKLALIATRLEELEKDRERLVNWICHNGGLLNEWAKEWDVKNDPPLTKFIETKLLAAMEAKQ